MRRDRTDDFMTDGSVFRLPYWGIFQSGFASEGRKKYWFS